jgi:hypothetical protein
MSVALLSVSVGAHQMLRAKFICHLYLPQFATNPTSTMVSGMSGSPSRVKTALLTIPYSFIQVTAGFLWLGASHSPVFQCRDPGQTTNNSHFKKVIRLPE